ncbi:hypothetical protein L1887_62092 [Cichorium endivia]|nr:hypothetical protein L1887_62092 [Cichorium endivia]
MDGWWVGCNALLEWRQVGWLATRGSGFGLGSGLRLRAQAGMCTALSSGSAAALPHCCTALGSKVELPRSASAVLPLSKLLLRLSSDLERIIRVLEICRVEAVRLGLTLLHRKEPKSRQAPTRACSTHTNTCTFCIAHALCRSSHTHHHCCSRHNGFRSSTEARRGLGAEEAALRTRSSTAFPVAQIRAAGHRIQGRRARGRGGRTQVSILPAASMRMLLANQLCCAAPGSSSTRSPKRPRRTPTASASASSAACLSNAQSRRSCPLSRPTSKA